MAKTQYFPFGTMSVGVCVCKIVFSLSSKFKILNYVNDVMFEYENINQTLKVWMVINAGWKLLLLHVMKTVQGGKGP